MKKIALSFAALALTASSALAADLPSRKEAVLPPPPPPPPMWTGFYVGLNAGGTWANSNQQTIGVGPLADTNNWANFPGVTPATHEAYVSTFASVASASGFNGGNGGFIGGGQIGYNWQVMNSFVAGMEADIQGVASSGTSRTFATGALVPNAMGDDGFSAIHTARGSLQYLGTVRGRLGWLAMPTLLLYGTGGLAYGGVSLNTASSVTAIGTFAGPSLTPAFGGVNFSNTQVGWTAGGGIEWMFLPNWSAKVEYLYYDLGTVTQNFALSSSDTAFNGTMLFGGQARARVNGNIVRAGVNYHFNWGAAPVVAKY
jgi:outer membrane immunogenic protein